MDKKSNIKRKRDDSNSSIVESSEETLFEHIAVKKFCILHDKCSHTTDKFKVLEAMVTKHKKGKLQTLCSGQERPKCFN